ncbi:glycosyltransferase family 39 protein [Kitasatospora hibisci]|uniref:glycosyltransferase family 39 protein n=1 Tax=Kitasatospora hibisci TaxID=3369522 RepID=UPI0037551170
MMPSETDSPWFIPHTPVRTETGEDTAQAGNGAHGPGHPDEPARIPGPAYPDEPAYRQDAGYPDAPEHPDAAAYPQDAGYPDGSAHPEDGPAPADPRFHPSDGPPVELAPYTIPPVPVTGWDPASSPRRRWIGRALLFGVLAVQAALSLRLLGAAHPDEAIAMIVGRQELDHLFDGVPMTTDLVDRIPGAPWLYPPLAGAAANASGIFGARVVSLVLALVTTVLAYSLTRRLFNERVAICGAAAYAVVQSTVVVGFYAAPDALAIALVAVAAWIVVRTARAPVALVLLAAPVAALAVAAEYAAVVALPAVLALTVLSASARKGRGPAALRALLLAVGTVGLLLPFGLLDDVASWSPTQGHEARSVGSVLLSAARWSGLFTLLACAGAAAYVRRERMYESPEDDEITATRLRRAALSTTLCGTALLIPVLYACLGTPGVMFRHLGFGMLFAAPLAGVGITRLVGAHFRNPQLGILVWVVLLALGLEQASLRYQDGPDSGRLLSVLRLHAQPHGRYLTEVEGLPEYYLGSVSKPDQWFSARRGTEYQDRAGVVHRGDDGTVTAVRDGWFNLVVLDSTAPSAMNRALTDALGAGGHYRLIAQFSSPTGDSGTYKVFLRY